MLEFLDCYLEGEAAEKYKLRKEIISSRDKNVMRRKHEETVKAQKGHGHTGGYDEKNRRDERRYYGASKGSDEYSRRYRATNNAQADRSESFSSSDDDTFYKRSAHRDIERIRRKHEAKEKAKAKAKSESAYIESCIDNAIDAIYDVVIK